MYLSVVRTMWPSQEREAILAGLVEHLKQHATLQINVGEHYSTGFEHSVQLFMKLADWPCVMLCQLTVGENLDFILTYQCLTDSDKEIDEVFTQFTYLFDSKDPSSIDKLTANLIRNLVLCEMSGLITPI